MAATLERHESHWLIRLEGQIGLASAAEFRALLLEWLAAGKDLELDLEDAEEIDITAMQLLWAAGREAARLGVGITTRPSGEVAAVLRDSGFEGMPGFSASAKSSVRSGSGDSNLGDGYGYS